VPIWRPDQLPPAEPREFSFGPFSVGDDWGVPLELWRANKLTILVGANPLVVQLARQLPPQPATWGAPIQLNVGPWSHVGPFGYWRFRNLNPGAAAVVSGTAYSE